MMRDSTTEAKLEADVIEPQEQIAPVPRISIQAFCETSEVAPWEAPPPPWRLIAARRPLTWW